MILRYIRGLSNKDANFQIWHMINQCNKKTLKNINEKLQNYNDISDVNCCMIKDIIVFKFHRADVDKEAKPVQPKCFIQFVNPAMESARISKVMQRCNNYWPLNKNEYKLKHHKPDIVFSYTAPIIGRLCNYKKVITDHRYGDLAHMTCECIRIDSKFRNLDGHVITGDYGFIQNKELAKVFSRGPKYRLRRAFDINECVVALRSGLNNYVDKVKERLSKPTSQFRFWIDQICKQWEIDARKTLARRNHPVDKNEKLSISAQADLAKLHLNYVVTPTDKAAQNLSIVCKKLYLTKLYEELSFNSSTYKCDSKTYELCNKTPNELINITTNRSMVLGVDVPADMRSLPIIYLIPKFHKSPIKFRTIIASKKCTTKTASKFVGACLSKVMTARKNYCKSIETMTGVNTYWIIDNNQPILDSISKLNRRSLAKTIDTSDFTTLYTNLRHTDIVNQVGSVIYGCMSDDFGFKRTGNKVIWQHTDMPETFNRSDILELIKYIIRSTYFTLGDMTFRQTIGIPMGTDCAPQLANLTLHNLEYDYMRNKMKHKDWATCKKLSNSYRYIDDISTLNGSNILEEEKTSIYPASLQLIKVNQSSSSADVLDLSIDIHNGKFNYKTYDKRRNFNFQIINFPHISSNIPSHLCYSIYKGQVVRHSKLNYNVSDFIVNIKMLNKAVKTRGYKVNILIKEFKDSVNKHNIDKLYDKPTIWLVNKVFK